VHFGVWRRIGKLSEGCFAQSSTSYSSPSDQITAKTHTNGRLKFTEKLTMTDVLIPLEDRRQPHPTAYTPDRRVTDMASIVGLVTEIHKDVKLLDAKLSQHMIDETSELAQEIAKLMRDAFPAGDALGHKAAHEAWIKQTEASAEFWTKMRFELTRWGLFGFIAWAFYALWKAALLGPMK